MPSKGTINLSPSLPRSSRSLFPHTMYITLTHSYALIFILSPTYLQQEKQRPEKRASSLPGCFRKKKTTQRRMEKGRNRSHKPRSILKKNAIRRRAEQVMMGSNLTFLIFNQYTLLEYQSLHHSTQPHNPEPSSYCHQHLQKTTTTKTHFLPQNCKIDPSPFFALLSTSILYSRHL